MRFHNRVTSNDIVTSHLPLSIGFSVIRKKKLIAIKTIVEIT